MPSKARQLTRLSKKRWGARAQNRVVDMFERINQFVYVSCQAIPNNASISFFLKGHMTRFFTVLARWQSWAQIFKCLGLSLVVGTGVPELFCLSSTRKYSVLLTMLLKISYHILQYFPMYFNQELEISECLKQVSKVCQSSNSQCYIKPVPTLHFSSTLHRWPNIEASRFWCLSI